MDKTVYEIERHNSNLSNYSSDKFLNINACGISRYQFVDKNKAVHQYRPEGRKDYHVLYMVKGKKEIVIEGKRYEMSPGDAALYMPHTPHDYTFFVDKASPVSESFYIHFSGTAAAEVVKNAGFEKSCFISSVSGEVPRLMISLIAATQIGEELTACGQLLRILPLLSADNGTVSGDSVKRINRQVEYISAHFAEEIDLDRCALQEGLSRSRFSHLFTEIVGMSPYKYQHSLRIEAAKEMLSCSSLSVGEIAMAVGFSDPLYFSRTFSRSEGCSPSAYRKTRGDK